MCFGNYQYVEECGLAIETWKQKKIFIVLLWRKTWTTKYGHLVQI